jgi:hypothetical protein
LPAVPPLLRSGLLRSEVLRCSGPLRRSLCGSGALRSGGLLRSGQVL